MDTTAANWTPVLDESALREGAMAGVRAGGLAVLIARVEGVVYAVSDRCAHMACLLSKGRLERHVVTCPCHDWRFDVRTGRFVDAPELGLDVFDVKSDGGRLFVKLP